MTVECSLCAELDEDIGRMYPDRFPNARHQSRILERNDCIAIIPSLGPLTDTHLLAVTIDHVKSFAASETRALQTASRIIDRFTKNLGPALVFEHGSGGGHDRAGSCVDHAHLHLLALPTGMSTPPPPTLGAITRAGTSTEVHGISQYLSCEREPESQLVWRPLDCIEKLGEGELAAASYLLYGSPGALMWTIAPSTLPSQFLRRHIYKSIGSAQPTWDWRSSPNIDLVDIMVDRLRINHFLGEPQYV